MPICFFLFRWRKCVLQENIKQNIYFLNIVNSHFRNARSPYEGHYSIVEQQNNWCPITPESSNYFYYINYYVIGILVSIYILQNFQEKIFIKNAHFKKWNIDSYLLILVTKNQYSISWNDKMIYFQMLSACHE